MKNQKKAYLFASLAILFWSTMSSAFKLTLNYIDATNLLFFASVTSLLILFLILLFTKQLSQLKEIRLKSILNSAFLGALNPFAYYLILFEAYNILKAQIAGTLNYFWPIVLVVLSIPILKQKISYKSLIAIFISFFGIVIISTEGNLKSLESNNLLGIALAVGSALFWALYWIYNVKDQRSEIPKLFLNFLFGTIYIFLYIIIFKNFTVPSENAIIGSLYIGLFEMGLTYVFWLKALKLSINTAKVSNLVYLSPFIALLIIRITIGEQILLTTFIGLIFIIGGIILQKYIDKAKPLI